MAQNKGAIVRYRAIDKCLRSRHGRYGWEELAQACSDALYDAFSEKMTVSRRQIFLDLNHMESNAGYRAIIKRARDGKRTYYSYEDPDFSIEKTPISPEEMDRLKETILMLNRFKGMPHFEWMEELLSKLEDKFRLKSSEDSVIGFEQNLDLKGLENITPLFEAIVNKQVLNIRYKSFKKNKPVTCEVHPYYLKQYNNRWFLFGWNTEFGAITNFALDRIEAVSPMLGEYRPKPENLDFGEYFDDVVGVTIPQGKKIEHIVMRVAPDRYPYIKNKPLHPSQHNYDKEYRISIDVIPNNELIALLLSFGSQLEVLEPQSVREMMREHVKTLNKFYK
ncbi:MAG: WYL domain-containing protein [Paludibacteraceae bacterium]|nr:WYL domain-containing protein [Paludibacteraceae bacterium]